MKNKSGITLIALVFTIIILLILSGIVITTLTQNEILEKTKQAKTTIENAENIQNNLLEDYNAKVNTFISNNRETEEKSNFKVESLLDSPIEFSLKNPNKNWTSFNQTFKLNNTIDNYDQILFNANVQDGVFNMRKSEQYFLTKNIKFNNSEIEDVENYISLNDTSISGGTNVVVYELRLWFKDGSHFFVSTGGTNFSTITVIRLLSIYGIKY